MCEKGKIVLKEVFVPDIGAYSNVDIIELFVTEGDMVQKDASILTLETEKATVEVPAPFAGVLKKLHVKVGDKVSKDSLIASLEIADLAIAEEEHRTIPLPENTVEPAVPIASEQHPPRTPSPQGLPIHEVKPHSPVSTVHAGPGVRRFARELGVDLGNIVGTGSKKRILKQDVQVYVKTVMTGASPQNGLNGGITTAPWPSVDFAKFGEITQQPLSRIQKLSGSYLHRNWAMVPHVTQFDEADITELEKFRKDQQPLAERQGIKLTVAVFIMKALTVSLKAFPMLNASLDESGSSIILKKYFHIGVAVDTPNGLVVPVIRDVDQKGLLDLAKELGDISAKARQGQLSGEDMQGSSFTLSSLGGVGGTAFTPIINVPDVAILGVSKAQIKPVHIEGEFRPRLVLPLSLSYDHRVIDGAQAARFTTFLAEQLSDIRRWAL